MLMIRERSWEISAWNSKVSPAMVAVVFAGSGRGTMSADEEIDQCGYCDCFGGNRAVGRQEQKGC